MKNNQILLTIILFLVTLFLSIGPGSAENIYSEQIDKGDGYQINNYVMHLTSTTLSGSVDPILDFYELKSDGSYTDLKQYFKRHVYADGTKFEFVRNSETINILVTNATSKYVIVDIITSGITVEYEKAVDGGVSNAKFTGEPNIVLTKEVDKTTSEIGDLIRVTIKAKNIGDGLAKQINIDRGLTSGFIFKEDFPITSQSELEVNEEYTMLIYTIEAITGGTFLLNPAEVTYFSSVSDDKYTSKSNTPTITVSEEPVETSEIKLIVSTDKTKLKRGNTVTFKVNVENLKDVPASNIRIEPIIPKNLTYVSGSEEIYIINEKPIIQVSSYGGYHKAEYMLTFKADQVGYDKLIVKWTYNNGVEEISNETSSEMLFISQGDFDFLAEFPIYVYLTPIIIILALAGWFYWRSNQFKM